MRSPHGYLLWINWIFLNGMEQTQGPLKDPWDEVFCTWPLDELRVFIEECRRELKGRERHKKDALFDEIFRLAEKT